MFGKNKITMGAMTLTRQIDGDLARRATPLARELLDGVRAVVISGPRQAGKSTLARHVQVGRGELITLDDPVQLELARTDPTGFLDRLGAEPGIDEFQRAGAQLLMAVKQRLDQSRARGQYLLTGSTRFLTTRRLAETLTGRVAVLELLPLSAGELAGIDETFIEIVFGADDAVLALRPERQTRADYAHRLVVGGFPELALGAQTARVRNAWCRSYIETVLAPTNVGQVEEVRLNDLPLALLRQLAGRNSGEIVIADLARDLRVNDATVRAHLELLATLYLVRVVPGWATSETSRSKKRPVVHLIDTALACHLLGEDLESLNSPGSAWFGRLLETFVVGELAKQASWSDAATSLHHYRDRDGREVDLMLERHRRVVAVEVKATSTPGPSHTRHMRYLQQRLGRRFHRGVVLHTGHETVQLGDRIVALPISALWAGVPAT